MFFTGTPPNCGACYTYYMDVSTKNNAYIRLVLLGGAIFALTFTIVLKQAQIPGSDYQLHMEQAASFKTLFPFHISYPLWHFLVFAVWYVGWYLLGSMPIIYACALVTSVVNVLIYVIIDRILSRYRIPYSSWLAFALCLVMPVCIPWYTESVYMGQISPVTWHNPTNLIAKPFALIIFFLIAEILRDIRDKKPISRKRYILLSILLFGSMLAKPSFFQGIVPALGIYMLISLICSKFRQWKAYLFLCLTFVPAFLMMLLQFYFAFHTGAGEGIGIGWMEVFRIIRSPAISSLLGLIFPLAYLLFNLKKSLSLISVRLSLLFTGCGWLEYALLYEKGERKYHGNFSWAAMLSYTILWVITTGLFFRDVAEMDLKNKKTVVKNTFLFFLWLLHLISGIYYVWSLLTVPGLWM